MKTETVPDCCAYCGLPLAGGRSSPPAAAYCCFGCRFAAEVTGAHGEEGAANWALTRLGVAIFFTMNVMVFTMALWVQDADGTDGTLLALRGVFRHLALVFALPVLLLLGVQLLDNAWDGLRRGVLTADWLLLAGVAAAYLYSVVSVVRDRGPVYFEVGCMVLVLVTLGRWLEATGRLKAGAAIEALHRLLPETVRRLRPGGDGADEDIIPLEQLGVGDRLRVLAGERIPCDGVLLGHAATVDEQVLTGESRPAVKEPGDRVLGGALNLDGVLLLEATAPPRGGALARLIELVRTARLTRGRFERLADRMAAVFLPAVVLLALAAFAWHAAWRGLDEGILTGLAVLLIACPCALGLATPMAVWTALGRAAGAGVLFRNGEALERLAAVRAVRLDKTGTLTTGTPLLSQCAAADSERPEVLRRAAWLAGSSTHAHSRAIAGLAAGEAASNSRNLPGRGVTATSGSESVWLGSPRLMEEAGLVCSGDLQAVLDEALRSGEALTCVGWGGRVRGLFVFREEFRPQTVVALGRLRDLGLDVGVLTGDHPARGAALEQELGVPVTAGLLPEDKVAAVTQARHSIGPVAMVGDGINDAPALAVADAGVALGCGADLARDAAPVCLPGDDLARLPWAIELARRTVRVIRQNLLWAFAYNGIGVGLACAGLLNPILAALAMVGSSLLVVGNSLRLGGFPLGGGVTNPPACAGRFAKPSHEQEEVRV
jgi:heavy metal translocating P-type ATPase